ARAPAGGQFLTDVLPGTTLLGLGAGTALNPVLLAATGDTRPEESGLASGLVNTSFMLGGAIGLAVLASIASTRTQHLLAAGHTPLAAFTGGSHAAFLAGAASAALAALLAARVLRPAGPIPAGPETATATAAMSGEPALTCTET